MGLCERYGSLEHIKKAERLIDILKGTLDDIDKKSNYATWEKCMMAMGTIYTETGQVDKQIKVAEKLVEHGASQGPGLGGHALSHQHALAALLTTRGEPGDFARAEELEQPFSVSIETRLGKDSPQALSSRRIMAKAVWRQGRESEARKLIDEIYYWIEQMGKGKYAAYKNSEKKMTDEMVEELENMKAIAGGSKAAEESK
jgi:hypothetical protein